MLNTETKSKITFEGVKGLKYGRTIDILHSA